MTTIKEIARESGYGVGTVSRVINNSPNVSPEAREKIKAVMEAYRYKPNSNAKHLKLQSQLGISVIVKGTQNMLFAAILEKIQAWIEAEGHPSLMYYLDQDADEVAQAEQVVRERRPYGIIFLGSNFTEGEKYRITALKVPCITITNDASALGVPNLSSISLDDTAAAYHIIEYLIGKGHREIGIIGGDPERSFPSMKRLTGSRMAFEDHGLEFSPGKHFAYARFSMEGGYRAAEELLISYPGMTAIFAMSDMMAIGAVRALYDHGLHVPQDISVVGYDGITLARYMNPKITTVRQNVEILSRRGVDILLECIDHPGKAIHEIVPYEMQEGASVRSIQ